MAYNQEHEGLNQQFTVALLLVAGRIKTEERAQKATMLAVEKLESHGFVLVDAVTVAAKPEAIRATMQQLIDKKPNLLLTIGGTGVGKTNQVPEITEEFLELRLTGLETALVIKGVESTPVAGISRGLVGLTSRETSATVIVNSPSSTGGIKDTISVIAPIIPNIFEGLEH